MRKSWQCPTCFTYLNNIKARKTLFLWNHSCFTCPCYVCALKHSVYILEDGKDATTLIMLKCMYQVRIYYRSDEYRNVHSDAIHLNQFKYSDKYIVRLHTYYRTTIKNYMHKSYNTNNHNEQSFDRQNMQPKNLQ